MATTTGTPRGADQVRRDRPRPMTDAQAAQTPLPTVERIVDAVEADERANSTADRYDPEREGIEVRIGPHTYTMRDVPVPRFKRFKRLWIQTFETFAQFVTGSNATNTDAAQAIWQLLEDQAPELLGILIPHLDLNVFEDEDEGVTFPQLRRAFEAGMEVNGLSFLKRALPFIMETVRIGMVRTTINEKMAERAEIENTTRPTSSGSSSSIPVTE